MSVDSRTATEISPKTMNAGADHPVNVAHREWVKQKGRKGFNAEEFDSDHRSSLFEFVVAQMDVSYCQDIHSFTPTTCSCLPDMVTSLSDKEVYDVAQALLVFAKQTKTEQQIRVMDWIAHDHAIESFFKGGTHRAIKQKRCVLPGTYNEMICKHRLAALVGYGKKKWLKCQALMKANKAPVHGLSGKESSKRHAQVYKRILDWFFEGIIKLATPRATRIVKSVVAGAVDTSEEPTTIIELRDKDQDLLELPSSMTKRGVYARFLKDQVGIVQVLDAQGRVAGVRGDEESDNVPEHYPSWRTFCRHWEKYHPNLVVAKPREDICEDCWRYANAFRFKSKQMDENADRNADEMDEEELFNHQTEEQENNERVIKEAGAHVEQAEIQRAFFNEKEEAAKESRFKQRSEKTVTWVVDFAQNMSWVTTEPEALSRVGLPDIKHVELFDKWRPLVPKTHWKDFIYFSEEPSAAKRKQVKDERASSKKARANRQRTENRTTTQQSAQSN